MLDNIIKAEQFNKSNEMINKYHIDYERGHSLPFRIETPAGWLGMKVGDWISTDDYGEHWTIEDEVFKKTYTYAC